MKFDNIYLSDGGNLQNIASLLEEGNRNVETLFFAMPDNLDGNLEHNINIFKEQTERFGIRKVNMHGPFFDLSLSSMEESINRLTRKRYEQAVEISEHLAVRQIVFHTQYNPQLRFTIYKNRWLDTSYQYFENLLKTTEKSELTFLIENMFEDDFLLIKDLLKALNSPRFGMCLDVGHVQVYGDESILVWIRELKDFIKYVHLSDNNGLCDDHLALGSGIIDFPAIFGAFEEYNINPDLCIEMNNEQNHRISIAYLESIFNENQNIKM